MNDFDHEPAVSQDGGSVRPNGAPDESIPPDESTPPDLSSSIRAAIGGSGLRMQFQPIFQLGNWLGLIRRFLPMFGFKPPDRWAWV